MVDVWNELGKALGRALKPLAEIGGAIWTGFGDAASGLITGFMGAAGGLKDTLEPTITGFMPSIIDQAADALTEGSPPPEIKKAVDKFILQLMQTIEKEAKTEGHSLPTSTDLAVTQGKLVSGIIGMYAATHAISIALDATQPLKDWGFKTAIMDMLYQFKMSDVIGPMIQSSIWASVVTPLRMHARSDNPYEVPGSAILPYLAAKGIIDDASYKLNMKYHAFDGAWSDAMLANTLRYPGFGDMRTMIHRGVMTWEDAKLTLEMNLVQADYIAAYETLLPSVPGAGDLVDMAVREAYEARSGDEEMPEIFVTEMAKQGFNREACLWFWRKHWVLPGVGQVYDMHHRTIKMPQTIEQFLKYADYAPEWRAPLEELSWSLPGRIEARWMFRWGEIDVTDLRDYLIKDGLNPEYADSVAMAMAKNQYMGDINREVANIKADYARGYSVESTLRADLGSLGYRSEIVEYHVADALADRVRSIRDEELKTLRAQYARGALTMAEILATAELIIVDKEARDAWISALPSAKQVMIMEETFGTEVNRLVANAKYDRVAGYKRKEDFVSRLSLLGLPSEVIDYHVMDAEEDRARKHSDKQLAVIEEGYVDDLITWEEVEEMAKPILVDEEAYNLWLDGVYLNKHKAVRV